MIMYNPNWNMLWNSIYCEWQSSFIQFNCS